MHQLGTQREQDKDLHQERSEAGSTRSSHQAQGYDE